MATRYRVVGPLAIAIVGGKRVTVGNGAYIPESCEKGRLDHLVDLGLVVKIVKADKAESAPKPEVPAPAKPEVPVTAPAGNDETPVDPNTTEVDEVVEEQGDDDSKTTEDVDLDALNVAQLREYAKAHDVKLGSARSREDIKAVLKAAE